MLLELGDDFADPGQEDVVRGGQAQDAANIPRDVSRLSLDTNQRVADLSGGLENRIGLGKGFEPPAIP